MLTLEIARCTISVINLLPQIWVNRDRFSLRLITEIKFYCSQITKILSSLAFELIKLIYFI